MKQISHFYIIYVYNLCFVFFLYYIYKIYICIKKNVSYKITCIITLFKEKPLITFKRGEVIKLPLKRKKGRVFIEPELASNIVPSEVRPGLSLASVTGELDVKDNVYTIKVITNIYKDK